MSDGRGVWWRSRRFVLALPVGVVGVLLWVVVAGGTQPYETYEEAVGTDGPAAQFRFDDTSGSSTIADSAGSYTATNSGIGLSSEGPFGGSKSGSFGGEAYASLPSNPLAGADEFTAEGWVDWSGGSSYEQPVFDFGSSTTNYMYLTPAGGGSEHELLFEIRTGASSDVQVTASKLVSKQWVYVAVTETSSGTITLYVNGEQVGQTTSATLFPSSLGSVSDDYLGKSQDVSAPLFEGSMSNVAFYSKALSAARIKAHYDAGEYPVNTAAPTISGTATDGDTLSAEAGSWSGLTPITYGYQWMLCNSAGAECANISSATETKYTLGHGDVGDTLRVAVTGSNSEGNSTATSAQTTVIAPLSPSNTALPAISGTAEQGQLLSASNGTWSGTPPLSYTYKWEACNSSGEECETIAGATSSSYRVAGSQVGGTLRVVVTAENAGGSKSATSEATGVVTTGPPVNTGLPVISGTVEEGQTLSASAGSWAGTEPYSYTYQWERCNSSGESCSNISGAAGSTYSVSVGDVGRTLRVVVTAKNSIGSTEATSQQSTVVVGPPVNTSAPAISGTERDGQALSASDGTWTGTLPLTYAYQWQSCNSSGEACSNISGATSSTYTLGHDDVGKTVRVLVTATNSVGSASVSSEASGVVVALAPSSIVEPTISGAGEENRTLTATVGEWAGTPTLEYSYQWQSCDSLGGACMDIAGATSSSYVLAAENVGNTVRVVVTATNVAGSSSASSKASAVVVQTRTLVYSSQFGSEGSGNGQFEHPADVAVAPDGDLWVLDAYNDRVEEFNDKEEYLRQFGSSGSGDGQLSSPKALAMDASGNLWVLDSGNERVEEFNDEGSYLAQFALKIPGEGYLRRPEGIAIDSHGDIWISDSARGHLAVFKSNGEYIKTVSSQGSEPGQLEEPEGLAIDSHGDVWVVDSRDDRIEEFNEEGSFVKQFGSWGTGEGQLIWPYGLAIDPEGNLLVAETGNDRVQKFTENGEYIQALGAYGSEEGEFRLNEPNGLAVDESGDVWVADSGNNRVEKWVPGVPTAPSNTTPPTIEGEPVEGESLYAAPGVWSGTQSLFYGYVWERCNVHGEECARIEGESEGWLSLEADDVGSTIRAIVTARNPGGSAEAVSAPSAVIEPATAPTNIIAPTLSGTARQGRILEATAGEWIGDPSPRLEFQWQRCNREGVECVDISGAEGATYELTASDAEHKVQVVVTATNAGGSASANSSQTAIVEPLIAPSNTALPSVSGHLNNGQTLTASRGSWTGTEPISYTYQWQHCSAGPLGGEGSGPGQFNEPYGVAVDSEGNIWIVDRGNDRVEEFSKEGGYIKSFGSHGSGAGYLKEPYGLSIDAEGHIWVADWGNNTVEEYNDKGEYLREFTAHRSKGGLANPENIAVDSRGNIWVAQNNEVVEYGSEGTLIRELGSYGSGEGQIKEPHGLAVNESGDVWVVDEGNSRIEEFTEEGVFIRAAGSHGSDDGQFLYPEGIVMAALGDLWITDAADHRIEKFSGEGEYLGSVSLSSADVGEGAPGLALGASGDLLVVDQENDELKEITDAGEYVNFEACTNISGATGSSYSLTSADAGFKMRLNVTASNEAGESVAYSERTAVVSSLSLPANISVPSILGTSESGETLIGDPGDWDGSEPLFYEYQWERCNTSGTECVAIPYAINEEYAPISADVGKKIRLVVTAFNEAGEASATSEATSVVDEGTSPAAPTNTEPPSITGYPYEAETLFASAGKWEGTGTIEYSYQWYSCNASGEECIEIKEATEPWYVLTEADIGSTLRVVVTATNAGGPTSDESESSPEVKPSEPSALEAPVVTGIANPGGTLSADQGSWLGTAPLSYGYQWQRCTGGTVGPYGENGSGVFEPGAVTVDTSGNIWAAYGSYYQNLEQFNERGEYLRSVLSEGQYYGGHPSGLTATANNDVWVTYAEDDDIQEFNQEGTYIGKIGEYGSGEGQLAEPLGIATSTSGNIWVIDAGNERIEEFSPSGEYLSQFSIAGFAGGVEPPGGIAVDASDDILLIDRTDDRIEEYNEHGEHLGSFGMEGSEDGQLRSPAAIATNSSGNIWVADAGNSRLEEFNEDGEYIGQAPISGIGTEELGKDWGLASDATGDIWAADPISGHVEEFSGTGEYEKETTYGECNAIEDATGLTYTPSESDVGSSIRIAVTATNSWGSAESTSATTPEIETEAPINTLAPSISGDAEDGQTLTTTPGTWHTGGIGPATYSYQWESCNGEGNECAPLEGATETSYELGEGDAGTTLRVTVTASNTGGETHATSDATAVVAAEAPSELEAPSISGTPDAEEVLHADPGRWSGTAIAFSYQWESCDEAGGECAPIEGATEPEYALGTGDVGTTLRVRIGAHSAADSLTDVSPVTPVIGTSSALASTGIPTISGNLAAGEQLVAKSGGFTDDAGSLTYQWSECNEVGTDCEDISGATSENYTPGTDQAGKTLRVRLSISGEGGPVSQVSVATQPVASEDGPVVIKEPTISGAVLVGHTLHVSDGAWSTEESTSYSYAWKRCNASDECTSIEGANEDSYTPIESDVGSTLVALVTATSDSHSTTGISHQTSVVEPETLVKFSAPSTAGVVQVGGKLDAEHGIWSGAGNLTYAYQWEHCSAGGAECSAIEGAGEQDYTVTDGDLHKGLRVKIAVDGPFGSTNATSALTAVTPAGTASVEEAIETAQHAAPALLAPSVSTTLEEQSLTPGLSDGEEDITATGTLTSSTISKEVAGEFSVNTPEGELDLTPQETSPEATTTPTIVNGAAAFFANTWPATDTIVRPTALGAITLLQMRSAEAPTSFSWEVNLGSDQELRQLPDGGVAVIDPTEAPPPANAEPGSEGEPAPSEEDTPLNELPEETEAEEPEEEALESLPSAPLQSTSEAEPASGLPQPQQTKTEYEAATTAMTAAESAYSGNTLMVMEPSTVKGAHGENIPASLSVSGNTITLKLTPSPATAYPVIVDPAVVSHTDKVSASASHKYKYGLAAAKPGDITHAGPSLEEADEFDPKLRDKPLSIKTTRLVVAYDVLTNPALGKEKERLIKWLQAAQTERLEPYITLGPEHWCEPAHPCSSGPSDPSVGEYQKAIRPLLKALVYGEAKYGLPPGLPQVTRWGAWNEPDLATPRQRSPLDHIADAAKAAQFWEVAQAILSDKQELDCTHCTMVAGEFAEDTVIPASKGRRANPYHRTYIEQYIDTVLCHRDCKATRYLPWPDKPHVWGLHDYSDLIAGGHHDAENFVKLVETKRTSDPTIWLSEEGVALENGFSATALNNSKSAAVDASLQARAGHDFRNLYKTSRHIELINYYMYSAPTAEEKEGEPHLFDSALLSEDLSIRPAYCTVVFEKEKCPPAVGLPPGVEEGNLMEEGGAADGADVCTISTIKVTLEGRVNPNGSSATYDFEYGTTTKYGHKTEVRSVPAGNSAVTVSLPVQLSVMSRESDGNCGTIYYRLAAQNGGGTTHGKGAKITFYTVEVS